MVAAVAQELVDQVAIGRVHFHAIETGVDRIAGGSPEVLDECRDLFDAQRAGLGYIFETVGGEGLALGTDRAGRHRHFAFRQQAGVGNAAHVPELQHDASALGVHCIGDRFPGGDLVTAVDARGVQIAPGRAG